MSLSHPLLAVRNLRKHFSKGKGFLQNSSATFKAVDNVNFDIHAGSTLGLVGESGSGKTTIGKCVIRLMEPTDGEIFFENSDISKLGRSALQEKRVDMQMIYQSPAASLNGRMTVGQIIAEPLLVHQGVKGSEARRQVLELLDTVGLKEEHYYRYPHEFSGGQQQRIGIARALSVKPKLLVLDEPTSGLDPFHQRTFFEIIEEFSNNGASVLLSSHIISEVEKIADSMAVLKVGSKIYDESYKTFEKKAKDEGKELEDAFFEFYDREKA